MVLVQKHIVNMYILLYLSFQIGVHLCRRQIRYLLCCVWPPNDGKLNQTAAQLATQGQRQTRGHEVTGCARPISWLLRNKEWYNNSTLRPLELKDKANLSPIKEWGTKELYGDVTDQQIKKEAKLRHMLSCALHYYSSLSPWSMSLEGENQ